MTLYNINTIKEKTFIHKIDSIYGSEKPETMKRILKLAEEIIELSGKQDFYIISSPGRTEICGNHTDHNNGKVLAAAVNLDMIALFVPEESSTSTIKSDGYEKIFCTDISSLKPTETLKGTTEALIKGIASGFVNEGYKVGGFTACLSSNVLPGSGLSSSAAIEVLIGMIFNVLYNDQKVSAIDLAKIGQYAENNFFMKACGLMDQVACASGSGVAIDFKDNYNPVIKEVDTDFKQYGYSLLIVNTGGSHDDLVEEYESIPVEMKKVAAWFGEENLRKINHNDIIENLNDIRSKCGDRAILRSIHFIEENERVDHCIQSLTNHDFDSFLDGINRSGLSSLLKLQNCLVPGASKKQELLFALEMTRSYLSKKKCKGAFRVHGGGFAGTIQVILPFAEVNNYKNFMIRITGPESVTELKIRKKGVYSF